MPGTPTILGVMVLAGWSEGFGIALFVPVLELLTSPAEPSQLMMFMTRAVAAVGLPLTLPVALGLVATFVIGGFALGYLQSYLLSKTKYQLIASQRRSVVASILCADWQYLSRQGSGETINILVKECERSAESLSHQVRFLACLVLLAAYASVAAFVSWPLLLLTGGLGAVILLIVSPLIRTSRRFGNQLSRANESFAFHSSEFLSAKKLIKVTAAENAVIARWDISNASLYLATFQADAIGLFLQFWLLALPVLGLAAIIFISAQVLALPPAPMLVVLALVARMMPRLSQLQAHYQYYVLQLSAVEVVDRVIKESNARREESRHPATPAPPDWNTIEFRDVRYRFPQAERNALEGISFAVPRNAMVAIVGPSGGGKSTIVDLLAGLVQPSSGSICVDGRDLSTVDLATWRRNIGYVTQNVVIFNDTLRNNLLFPQPKAAEQDIDRAVRIAQLESVVALLPQGLDTVLGEGGATLSGGERQRVAIARALLGKPTLLLLDEATSALDNESERLVQQAIEEISHQMTIVLVAHRLSTVRKADLIVVIDGGRVVEAGGYPDLLKQTGAFARLHETQFPQ